MAHFKSKSLQSLLLGHVSASSCTEGVITFHSTCSSSREQQRPCIRGLSQIPPIPNVQNIGMCLGLTGRFWRTARAPKNTAATVRPGPLTLVVLTIFFRTKQQAIREGGATFIPIVVEQAQSQDDTDSDMCVSGLSVAVEIDHSCTGQLQLTLYGPGPPPGDSSYPENTPRAEPALLFVGYNGTDGVYVDADRVERGIGTDAGGSGGECGDGMVAIFTDAADRGVWECCGNGR